jgi:hypothetical protein
MYRRIDMSVKLTINTCKDCPNLDTERFYTADSWEHVMTWFCKKTDRAKPASTDALPVVKDSSLIAHVERASEEPKKIPTWCPLRNEA